MKSNRQEQANPASGFQSTAGRPLLAPVLADPSRLTPLWPDRKVGAGSEQRFSPSEFILLANEKQLDAGSQPLSSVPPQCPPSLPAFIPNGEDSAKPPPLPNNLGQMARKSGVKKEAISLSFDEIRAEYIGREASIRAWGWVVFTVAVLFVCIAVFVITILALQVIAGGAGSGSEGLWTVILFALVCGVVVGAVSYGLLKLQRWCKWLIIIVACALVWSTHPIALAVGLVIIFSLCDRKTSMVFSNQYKTAIKNTPHLKYHPSKGVVVEKRTEKVSAAANKR